MSVVSSKMYSVVKAERKILKRDIESIPEIWIRGSKQKYFLCPPDYSERIFINAARNCFTPLASWMQIKCQILESRFSSYQLAKEAENRIVKNMKMSEQIPSKRIQHVNNEEVAVAIHSETEDLDKVISKKVEDALSGIWRNEESDFQKELEKMISGMVLGTIAEHLEGAVGGTCDAVTCSQSVNEFRTTIHPCAVDSGVSVECSQTSVPGKDFAVGDVDDTCGMFSTSNVCTSGSIAITLPIRESSQTTLVNKEIPKNYDYFLKQVATGGGKKLANTMRIVSNSIITDSVLKKYSMHGQRKKDPFNVYPNIIAMIVKCTTAAHNEANAFRKEFVSVTELEVQNYFTESFIKHAEQRDA